MALTVKQNRYGIWQIHGTVAGRRIRRSAKTRNKRLAEEQAAQIEAQVYRRGLYGESEVLFEEACLAYMKDGGEARFMMPLLQHFRGTRLRDITPHAVRAAAQELYPEASPATQNRQAITPASAVINFGHQQGGCGAIRVRRFPEEQAQRKAVGRGWIDAFMAEAPQSTGALYLFCHQTAARVSEAVELKWEQVDLRAMTAMLLRTKNGKPRLCRLTAEMCGLLADLGTDGRVFGYASRFGVYGAARRACKRAGIEYLPPHQAGRHSFATILSEQGMSPKAIAEAGGWLSPELVSRRYDHPDNAGRRAAEIMGRMGEKSAKPFAAKRKVE